MKTAPCGGCPPCCNQCVFDNQATALASTIQPIIIVPAVQYGCVRTDGGDVVKADGILGMMRGENFHPVNLAGAAFLRATGNQLATHC